MMSIGEYFNQPWQTDVLERALVSRTRPCLFGRFGRPLLEPGSLDWARSRGPECPEGFV